MNFVICGESCRWQEDGLCTLQDITRVTCGTGGCPHYEKP